MPNLLALFVVALVPMIVGFIYYHPKVLGAIWQREAGVTDEKLKGANMLVIFGLSFFFSLILSVAMNTMSTHDGMVGGATYYVEQLAKKDSVTHAQALQETKEWQKQYQTTIEANPLYTTHRLTHGFAHGLLVVGIFILLPVIVTNGLFERKSWKYVLINSGYWILTVTNMCTIHAVWR